MPYTVAFRYTKGAGGYAGVVTWTQFLSKEDFNTGMRLKLEKLNQEVVEEGITTERATELCRETPVAAMIRAAIEEATIPGTNLVNKDILELQLTQVLLARLI